MIKNYRDPARLWLGEDVRQRNGDTGGVYVAGREQRRPEAAGDEHRR